MLSCVCVVAGFGCRAQGRPAKPVRPTTHSDWLSLPCPRRLRALQTNFDYGARSLALSLFLSLHSCAILCVNRERERERDVELWQHSLRVAKLTLSAVDFHQPQCFSAPLTLLACSSLLSHSRPNVACFVIQKWDFPQRACLQRQQQRQQSQQQRDVWKNARCYFHCRHPSFALASHSHSVSVSVSWSGDLSCRFSWRVISHHFWPLLALSGILYLCILCRDRWNINFVDFLNCLFRHFDILPHPPSLPLLAPDICLYLPDCLA